MHRSLILGGVALLLLATSGVSAPVPKPQVHPLFTQVDAKSLPPKELIETYAAFVEQAQKDGEVEKFCLPVAVRFVNARPQKSPDIGEDISKAFLVKGFEPEVWSVRKVSDECYLLRTATTSISFIQTKSGAWLVYKYVDRMAGC